MIANPGCGLVAAAAEALLISAISEQVAELDLTLHVLLLVQELRRGCGG